MPPTNTPTRPRAARPRLLTTPYGPVPVVWVTDLYHRGKRPGPLTPRRYDSHEGDALSVVRDAEMLDDWSAIAHSGGTDWRLHHPTPVALVDAHALRTRAAHRALLAEAVRREWLTPCTVTVRAYQDDEIGDVMHETLTSPEEIAEYDAMIAEGEDVGEIIRRADYEATPVMRAWWAERFTSVLAHGKTAMSPPDAAIDRLLREMPALHGQWWHDDYRPECYSCPRGGLWTPRLVSGDWTISALRS